MAGGSWRAKTIRAGTTVLAAEDKVVQQGDTHEGTVVSVTADKLVMKGKAKDGEEVKEHTHILADNAKVMCDGKECKLAELKKGQKIRVTTKKGDGPPRITGTMEGGSFGTFNQTASASGSEGAAVDHYGLEDRRKLRPHADHRCSGSDVEQNRIDSRRRAARRASADGPIGIRGGNRIAQCAHGRRRRKSRVYDDEAVRGAVDDDRRSRGLCVDAACLRTARQQKQQGGRRKRHRARGTREKRANLVEQRCDSFDPLHV